MLNKNVAIKDNYIDLTLYKLSHLQILFCGLLVESLA